MNDEEVFNLSYWRVFEGDADGNLFAEDAYGVFLRQQEIAAKFAHSNPGKPKEMLRLSVSIAAAFYFNRKPELLLAKFAELHSLRHLDIEPHLYAHWLNSVLAAVKLHDPKCDERVLSAWRNILTPAIEFMQSKYSA
ncbi:MAG: hypothetical protein NTY53_18015 [Kiritimatiellaeota bacterium]|nr:hypothetical protein [Kiritimatiellota bacterium]